MVNIFSYRVYFVFPQVFANGEIPKNALFWNV